MEEKVLQTIKKYNLIENGDKIVIGVSGGPDSICLLDVLNNIKRKKIIDFDIYVAHINHMIREEASNDMIFVKEFCYKKNIPFFSKNINILEEAKNNKAGTEETGRIARYNFFEEVLKETHSNKIATAHTANDNAETVLMNIIRGTGISGLKGIVPNRDGKFIRPLIDITRDEIEKYCEDENLNPRIDKTNKENIYTRNKIRNLLIPYIKENYNPSIVEALNRLSKISSLENDYIDKKVKEEYEQILISENFDICNQNDIFQGKKYIEIELKKFNSLELVIKQRIILYTINRLLGNCQGIELVHIKDIIKLCENSIGNKFLVPNKKIKIIVKNKKIFFVSNS